MLNERAGRRPGESTSRLTRLGGDWRGRPSTLSGKMEEYPTKLLKIKGSRKQPGGVSHYLIEKKRLDCLCAARCVAQTAGGLAQAFPHSGLYEHVRCPAWKCRADP